MEALGLLSILRSYIMFVIESHIFHALSVRGATTSSLTRKGGSYIWKLYMLSGRVHHCSISAFAVYISFLSLHIYKTLTSIYGTLISWSKIESEATDTGNFFSVFNHLSMTVPIASS